MVATEILLERERLELRPVTSDVPVGGPWWHAPRSDAGSLTGATVVGHPEARALDDGLTCEGNWLCVVHSRTRVVDKDGAPAIVYHGTSAQFNRFDENPRGIFFGEDIDQAEPYSRIRPGTPRIIAAYLSVKNPWTMVRYTDDFPISKMIDQSIGALRARGYDGIHAPDDKVWIVFDAHQILPVDADASIDDSSETLSQAPGYG